MEWAFSVRPRSSILPLPRARINGDIVLGDDGDRELDVHAFEFDENGKVIDKPYWDAFEADALDGVGHIAGVEVRCVTIDHLLKTLDENKRELRDKDRHDLALLLEVKNRGSLSGQ